MNIYSKSFCNSIDYNIKLVHKTLVFFLNDNYPIREYYSIESGYFHTPLESQYDIYEVGLCAYDENRSITAPAINLYIGRHIFRKFKSFYTENIPTVLKMGGAAEKYSCKKKKHIFKLGSIGEKTIKFTPTKLKRFL